jgi:hypothetical protein
LRVVQVDLFSDLLREYAAEMEEAPARILAAQVVNFLKGEDIAEVAHASAEPLRSQIGAVLPQVSERATKKMRADRQTREIVVATLRMMSVLGFSNQGKAWFSNPAQKRIEQLLAEYGPEFPQEITPAKYEQLTATYHAAKRDLWAAG